VQKAIPFGFGKLSHCIIPDGWGCIRLDVHRAAFGEIAERLDRWAIEPMQPHRSGLYSAKVSRNRKGICLLHQSEAYNEVVRIVGGSVSSDRRVGSLFLLRDDALLRL